MSYTWLGNTFDPSDGSVETNVMNDNSNNVYFYDANYNGFFPLNINNGIASYGGGGDIILLPANTILNLYTLTDANFAVVSNEIITSRLNAFLSDPQNIINSATQTPSTLIINTLTTAVSANNLSSAYAASASYLTSLNMNFAFNDIANHWVNGQNVLKSMSNILSTHQNIINNLNASTNGIIDFKKKIIRGQTMFADSVRKVQNDAYNFSTTPTFTRLVSSFPNELGKTVSAFGNSHQVLGKKLSHILPSNLGSSSQISNLLNNFIGGAFNGVIPPIVNPIDKLLVDVNNINTATLNGFAQIVPSEGFGSFAEQQIFVNQTVNLLNNIIAKIPITSQVAKQSAVTNPAAINNAVSNYYKSVFGLQTTNTNTQQQATVNQTLADMQTTDLNAIQAAYNNQPYLSTDPASGGSFFNQGVYTNLFGGEIDQSVTSPNITLSPDPSIQASQNGMSTNQLKANQGTSFSFKEEGAGVNLFEDVILRPRNIPIDGTTGTYNLNKNTLF